MPNYLNDNQTAYLKASIDANGGAVSIETGATGPKVGTFHNTGPKIGQVPSAVNVYGSHVGGSVNIHCQTGNVRTSGNGYNNVSIGSIDGTSGCDDTNSLGGGQSLGNYRIGPNPPHNIEIDGPNIFVDNKHHSGDIPDWEEHVNISGEIGKKIHTGKGNDIVTLNITKSLAESFGDKPSINLDMGPGNGDHLSIKTGNGITAARNDNTITLTQSGEEARTLFLSGVEQVAIEEAPQTSLPASSKNAGKIR